MQTGTAKLQGHQNEIGTWRRHPPKIKIKYLESYFNKIYSGKAFGTEYVVIDSQKQSYCDQWRMYTSSGHN